MKWLILLALIQAVFGDQQNTTSSQPLAAIKPWYRSQEEKDRAVRLGGGAHQDEENDLPVYWSELDL